MNLKPVLLEFRYRFSKKSILGQNFTKKTTKLWEINCEISINELRIRNQRPFVEEKSIGKAAESIFGQVFWVNFFCK